ncbi:hypothetical protein COV24_03880 [candidate division WWE3 bacterium CG10_big_fil_rev_8_21_14_0_10_32_10]|uniref:Methyltransferase domain-containing protein n=1 Tax=candidate division WWE3 bacterium CG10_big_fil_rev_8_21_14_0_10_32_10 TaxID=1975090 RepID=A0A2H0R9N6_UNCKA|nr:MAG: hypothetical protein COV24_03880 [candidate division WWE3 bacterium CG10_big_fil_rev_8_21_14_0_10_32_10]
MLSKKFWEKYFKTYDVLNVLIPYQELLDTIIDKLKVKPGEKILDAGSGTGNLAIKLEMLGAQVTGVEYFKKGNKNS